MFVGSCRAYIRRVEIFSEVGTVGLELLRCRTIRDMLEQVRVDAHGRRTTFIERKMIVLSMF
jgi:hypothetical protein